jgi:hypothetical protein
LNKSSLFIVQGASKDCLGQTAKRVWGETTLSFTLAGKYEYDNQYPYAGLVQQF